MPPKPGKNTKKRPFPIILVTLHRRYAGQLFAVEKTEPQFAPLGTGQYLALPIGPSVPYGAHPRQTG